MNKQDITNFDEKKLSSLLTGNPAYRIRQIFEWLWIKDISSFDDFSNLPKSLRNKLSSLFYLPAMQIKHQQVSEDGTVKTAFELIDKQIIEGVLIPDGKRVTACISSQVGCNVQCSFCATGKMGFSRNLSTGEIIFQVKKLNSIAQSIYGKHLSNIVFMGMGEPLLNYKNVLRASVILTDKNGLAISPQRITISSVGIADAIIKLANEKVRFNLAVSLHTVFDAVRNILIPVNKQYPLDKLRKALQYFHSKTSNRITLEYLLMKGINDSEKDASALAEFTKAFPCKINIIEYNPVKGIAYQKPEKESVGKFVDFLKSKNLIVMVRRSRGKDIDAACGQLATKINRHLRK